MDSRSIDFMKFSDGDIMEVIPDALSLISELPMVDAESPPLGLLPIVII